MFYAVALILKLFFYAAVRQIEFVTSKYTYIKTGA
jgi:hypothetical protein